MLVQREAVSISDDAQGEYGEGGTSGAAPRSAKTAKEEGNHTLLSPGHDTQGTTQHPTPRPAKVTNVMATRNI